MKKGRIFVFIELVLFFIFYLLVLLSINIPAINIILGFIIVFILPGYNLLNIIKPNSNTFEKIGYSIIFSLVIDNFFMLFCYIIFYNYMTYPETASVGFLFNSTILINAIIIINLVLIVIKAFIQFKLKNEIDAIQPIKKVLKLRNIRQRLNIKIIPICLLFVLSLIFLCFSTIHSNVPNNDYLVNYVDYRATFTFFERVPLIFYLFLILSISSLLLIVFFSRNNYIILISISIFIYCLWILPYLQINNYFSHDTYLLSEGYQYYLKYGLVTLRNFNFSLHTFDTLRYSTGICTAILLTSATNVNIDFALWYLYPLLFIFIPFLFYSIFKKYSEKNKKEIILIILVIFSTFMPYFIKSGHATGTGLLGVLVYTILILEFYNLVIKNKFDIAHFSLIIALYLFLCLTHTEEAIYFLVFLILYYVYYTFYELMKIKNYSLTQKKNSINIFNDESYNLREIIVKELKVEELKTNFIKLGFFLSILIVIFYLVQEFFGWVFYYLNFIFGRFPPFSFIIDIYINTQFGISFFLRGGITFCYIIIIIIFLGMFLFSSIIYYTLFKKFNFFEKLYHIGIKFLRKIVNFLRKIISKKLFPIICFVCLFLIAIFLEYFILKSYEESLIISITAIILSYFVFILQILFFIKGIEYYELKNNKQNFFLLSILASASIIPFLIITGDIWLSVYFLHSKFSTNFILFNILIIQNTYIRKLSEKKFHYLRYITILVVSLGVFYCLRKLAFG